MTTAPLPKFDFFGTARATANVLVTAIAGILPTSDAPTKISPEHGVTRVQQADGTYKWFAINPRTMTHVEIDPKQAWFWTPEWQAGEKEVDEHLAAGRYMDFDDVDDFFDTPIP